MLGKKIKSNIVPFIVAVTLFGSCCVAWYLKHPASPYHKRYTFVVSYDAIGTLSPGNRVEVRGITKGKIKKVELTEDAVYVTAEVLADTKIPRNSEFRLITAGLMGEREMCVLSGDATEYIADGDTVKGLFENGTSGISKDLFEAMESLNEVKNQIMSLKDSLTVGSMGALIESSIKKGEHIKKTMGLVTTSWATDAGTILDNCDRAVENAKGLLESTRAKADNTSQNVEEVVSKADELLGKVRDTKAELKKVAEAFDRDDNTAGAIISGKGRLIGEIDRISRDVDALSKDIKKTGLKLNVDIF
ncbi:MAG: MlaD family protein [Fibrobacter sp.]|nr:MlaD family protein [Fibrobacter sp.]